MKWSALTVYYCITTRTSGNCCSVLYSNRTRVLRFEYVRVRVRDVASRCIAMWGCVQSRSAAAGCWPQSAAYASLVAVPSQFWPEIQAALWIVHLENVIRSRSWCLDPDQYSDWPRSSHLTLQVHYLVFRKIELIALLEMTVALHLSIFVPCATMQTFFRTCDRTRTTCTSQSIEYHEGSYR